MVTAPQDTMEETNKVFSFELWAAAFSMLLDDVLDLFQTITGGWNVFSALIKTETWHFRTHTLLAALVRRVKQMETRCVSHFRPPEQPAFVLNESGPGENYEERVTEMHRDVKDSQIHLD